MSREDAFGDIWDQVEGPTDGDEPEASEAFTEFAANPRAYSQGPSLRRSTAAPAPVIDVEGPDEEPPREPTEDDVRSLLDKVMEEALPTNPAVPVPAFPEDGTPTLRPDDGPPRGPSTQLVDAEAAAIAHAVGAERPESFDRLPDAISDEVKAVDKVLRGQPSPNLSHLTDDLAIDIASTAVRPPQPAPAPAPPVRYASDPLPAFLPDIEPAKAEEVPLELAFDPKKRAPTTPRTSAAQERLLEEVTPKANPKLLIGLAVALLGMLGVLVLKSLL